MVEQTCPLQVKKMLGDEALFSISSSHLYDLREEGEGEEKTEARLPQAVTTPRRGPLVLRVSRGSGKEASSQSTCPQPPKQGHGMFLLTKKPKSSLTRFPVVMVQRPLQQIEEELGQLSCAALKDNIQLMPVSCIPFPLLSQFTLFLFLPPAQCPLLFHCFLVPSSSSHFSLLPLSLFLLSFSLCPVLIPI